MNLFVRQYRQLNRQLKSIIFQWASFFTQQLQQLYLTTIALATTQLALKGYFCLKKVSAEKELSIILSFIVDIVLK